MAGNPIDLDVFDDESYSTEPIWDLSDEEDEESEDELFWEREFGDELESLPLDKEVGTFDPEGDLAYLEALLAGNPMTDINQEEVVVEEEEHHSWPVVLIANARKSLKSRERAIRRTPGIVFQRLMPGKFKFWCSNPVKYLKFFYNSTIKFLNVYEERVELNGLDRVQVKEKPPD
ncbi:hypothetical protein HanXRQr2_Chr01g0022891 [Helianthus annuus]|uniref:Uncharacterized protein n=1 Tax=Helianthus annuus TaxID=4232 RepID=A0A9K3P4K9_HELAN|nr:hypothetical protein HanXRQr2_Chr01g0022891 [Helianthus annuus]